MYNGPIKTNYWPVVCPVAPLSFSETYLFSNSNSVWLQNIYLQGISGQKEDINNDNLQYTEIIASNTHIKPFNDASTLILTTSKQ